MIKLLVYCFIAICIMVSCIKKDDHTIEIDFNVKDTNVMKHYGDSLQRLRVAISAMISPKETFVFYKELIEYLSEKLERKIELVQRKTYQEVNSMLELKELDFAFICSGAYVEFDKTNPVEIIAVPQTNGRTEYQAYIISNKRSKIEEFNDFKGKSFAFTDKLSNSGRLYVLKKLKYLGESENAFFSSTIYSHAHDNSIQLVNRGIIDGATIDGLIYNYMEIYYPDKLRNVKIIEKSEYFGIPPVVALRTNVEMIDKIRKILIDMHKDSVGREILGKLLIERFVLGYDSSYNSIRVIKKFVNE